ncbi:putative alpha/beta hydrolase [Talaromyces proteolyticus]|uniref:Alpha/beta hydrolase n=1 Tax=Talaromyces proteolyticus TaxID=1131652 RepID=A0AAD4KL97_9EURO|nr:putative alpha/beta hydrolase [Talaromyces proteolyticus]KAH8692847.1 putative alpha/beta hydrolase [Talaromyces proteolyticus]
MANPVLAALSSAVAFSYGILVMFYYWSLTVRSGIYFRKSTAAFRSELATARDRFWNLSKQSNSLYHRFLTLHDGFKFHYVTNVAPDDSRGATASKPLVILIHGFPDSWGIWRKVLDSTALRESCSLVAVDMPGYGGSDILKKYSATEVLDKFTEFIVALRERYGFDDPNNEKPREKVIIVAHDWGAVISNRLAAEAPQLADRFILTNGPLIGLVTSNIKSHDSSAVKMLKIFLHSPLRSRSMLGKALYTLRPVLRQVLLSGYIFALQLPLPFIRIQGTSGDFAWLRMVHLLANGTVDDYTVKDATESMATSLGPSAAECATETFDHETYPKGIIKQQFSEKFINMVSYYRHGTSVGRWNKSIETITALHSLGGGDDLGRRSSRAGVFDDGPKGALRAKATVVWALNDHALDQRLNLDGIGDYLVHNSQVISLPRSGHFTPIERESGVALQKIVEWAVAGEKEDVNSVVQAVYPGASVTLRT